MAKRNETQNPFIDPAGYQKTIEQARHDYATRLTFRTKNGKSKIGNTYRF